MKPTSEIKRRFESSEGELYIHRLFDNGVTSLEARRELPLRAETSIYKRLLA